MILEMMQYYYYIHYLLLYLINVFKDKINCHSIIDTIGIRMPAKQIREFSAFSVSSALRCSPSDRYVTAAKNMQILGHS
jgi:hypothetical protein